MTTLKIAPNLSLPLDAVTETAAILGRRGSGKTHTAVVMCEEMLGAALQVVVLDPLDVWWGLRAGADGKSEGLPILVVGGHHGDVPLDAAAGKLLADLVVDENLSAVLSLRHLSKGDQRRFVADFGERLYDRKGEDKNRRPLHLFVDEADAFVPQRLVPGAERTFGAIDTLVRRGRSSGVGCTLISQRAAVIAKDVLTQTEMLVCHQTTGPQDRKALEAWIEANDADNRRADFMASLASLKRGTAWFWSPSWLRVFQKVEVRGRRTFDSSSTPRAGAVRAEPKRMAPVDLAALREKLATTVERAKADDPKALKGEIARLQKELSAKPAAAPAPAPERVEVPIFSADDRAQLKAIEDGTESLIRMWSDGLERLRKNEAVLTHLREVAAGRVDAYLRAATPARPMYSPTAIPSRQTPAPRTNGASNGKANGHASASQLAGGEARILTALVQHGAMPKAKLALIAGYTAGGGGFNNYLSALRTRDLITRGEPIEITAAGEASLPPNLSQLPTGAELARWWLEQSGKLGRAERAIVEALLTAGGDMPKAAVAAAAGYEPGGGGFNNAISRLCTLGLVRRVPHGLRAAPEICS